MSERITAEDVAARVANVNRRMAERDVTVRYAEQYRNGYCALDRWDVETGSILATVTVGTKREVAEFLHAMMVALDDVKIFSAVEL